MKTVYIPKGTTVRYESLVTDRLVVKGHLQVTYGVKAKSISGNGVICAGTISADVIRADELEAASITCQRLIAKRVQAPEVFASESAAVSCFLSSAYVETGKLTVAVSEIDEVKALEVVNLAPKKRTLLGTLLLSALRSFWTALTAPAARNEPVDADYEIVGAAQEEKPEEQTQGPAPGQEAPEPVDEELNRIINLFKLNRDAGYTLRIIPGTPEENAPVFDFDTGHIVKPAA